MSGNLRFGELLCGPCSEGLYTRWHGGWRVSMLVFGQDGYFCGLYVMGQSLKLRVTKPVVENLMRVQFRNKKFLS